MSNYEAPAKWVPATMTADQVREVNALNAVEVELIDEAIGRVLASIERKGWGDDVDVVFTSDHGELQGDFGLLFKGPYHVDALMRLPLIWRPARSTGPDAERRARARESRLARGDVPRHRRRAGAGLGRGGGVAGRRRGRGAHAASTRRSPSGTRRSSASTCTCERS